MYTALSLTTPSLRILTRSASKNTTGYITSNGRLCQAIASAMTSSVTELIKSGETRSEEHTSELQSLMRISYAVFCLKKKKITPKITTTNSTPINNTLINHTTVQKSNDTI